MLGRALCGAVAFVLVSWAPQAAGGPIRQHPDNPRYFLFRGKPTVLVTSGEHYGALLNLDFDYVRYFDELAKHGFNLTRTFAGSYREMPLESQVITGNPLAPPTGRFIAPWARSETPGYFDGGNKFDLGRWDPSYFKRLHDLIAEAGKRGIVVELVFFCPMYSETHWKASPLHDSNNVNGVGKGLGHREALTLKDAAMVAAQDAMVRKIVEELKDADNLYYEICNEPYLGGVPAEWERHVAEVIASTEGGLKDKHLIAQNVPTGKAAEAVRELHPAVSVVNLHYADRYDDPLRPLLASGKVLSFDETGDHIQLKRAKDYFQQKYFHDDWPYTKFRMDGWDFLLAGGGVYDHLDFSFTTRHEDGSALFIAPGGGGEMGRRQLAILKKFLEGFDFIKMAPDRSIVRGGVPAGAKVQVLVEPGKQVALYLRGGTQADLRLDLPAGTYKAEWLDPKVGKVMKAETLRHDGGERTLASPAYEEDIALKIVRP